MRGDASLSSAAAGGWPGLSRWPRADRLLRSPLVALIAGVAHSVSFAPFEAWWLQLLALAVLAHAVAGAPVRGAAWRGWLFCTGWLVAGLWWLYISMHDHGGLPAWMAALAVLLLSAWLALYGAAAMALFARLRSAGRHPLRDAALFAACWMLAELARATLFTGFPWIASGYAHAVGPLAAWAPWIGVYGLCALAALAAWALAAWLRPAPWRVPAALGGGVLALAAVGLGLPSDFTRSTGTLQVSLLQPSIAQDLKFDPARLDQNLQQLAAQIAAARGTVVVTPESVVPLARRDVDDAYWNALHAPFKQGGRGLLLGIFLGDDETGYVNSVVGLSAAAEDYRYGKRHLLPFGEFIPPGFGWFVRMMRIPLSDQERGRNTASFEVAGQRLRPLICYEDLFGEDFVDSAVGPQAATVFVNVSNLAWFGRLLVQDQHLQFSQMRALEFQRPVVRATNTGATAVVDPRGRVTARLPAWTEGTLEAGVEGRSGETPYARWLAAAGLWPLWAVAAAVVAAAWRGRRRRDTPA